MRNARAQTSPLAVALLVGIVVTGAFTVVLFGGGLVDSLSTTAESERAAQEMSHFASETAAVALGGSHRRHVDFAADDGKLTVDPDASWICVRNGSVDDREFVLPQGGDAGDSCRETHTRLGTAEYTTGDTTVAYEGGGVWRLSEHGESRMVSPPEFHYRGETLTLPVVQLDGDVAAKGSTVDLTATAGDTERVEGISNPLADDSGRVYVTVHSRYYEAWGEFIAERTAGRVVELDHDHDTVTVELVVPSPPTIDNAIYTSGTSKQAVYIQNMEVDSYDTDSYDASTANDEGDVTTDGGANPIKGTVEGDVHTVRQGKDVTVASKGRVDGSVHSQRAVLIKSQGEVTEDVLADDTVAVKSKGVVGGDVHAGGDVTVTGQGGVDGTVYAGGDVTVTGQGVVGGDVHAGGDVTVTGQGRVDGTVHAGGDVTVTGNGEVGGNSSDAPEPPEAPAQPVADPPAVELPPESAFDEVPDSCTNGGGTIQVQSSDHCRLPPGTYNVSKLDVDQGKLTFEQGGRIELYVASDLSLSSGTITTAPAGEHDATRVEINYYGHQEASVLANVTGVINAPHVKVDMDAGNYQPHVFGAVIAETVQGDNGVEIHYDEALAGRTVGDGRADAPSVQYLHVTTNEMTLEE